MQGLAIQRTQAAELRPPQLASSFRVIEPLSDCFLVARRLVADALPARDPAAVARFNRGSRHAAVLSWADGDTAWTDANGGVVGVVPPPTFPIVAAGVAVVEVPPLHIYLGHLDALGLGRSEGRGSHQRHCRHDKSEDFHHGESSLDLKRGYGHP